MSDQIDQEVSKLQSYIDGLDPNAVTNDFVIAIRDTLIAANDTIATYNTYQEQTKVRIDYLIGVGLARVGEIITLMESLHWIADAVPATTPEGAMAQRDLFIEIAKAAIADHPEGWPEFPPAWLQEAGDPRTVYPAPEVRVGPMPSQFDALVETMQTTEATALAAIAAAAQPIAEEPIP